MSILINNIGKLMQVEEKPVAFVAGSDMSRVPFIENAWLLIEEDIIAGFGTMDTAPGVVPGAEIIDAKGCSVFPSFCDSHTHLVYAGSREREFVDKIRGLSYEEIAKRGGGILNSARRLHDTSEDELYEQSVRRAWEIIRFGTGAAEMKSGYGLTTEDELKMLRVIRRIKEDLPLTVKATFLGAHAIPDPYREDRDKYVDLIVNEMIPAVAAEKLADYVDVFCDKGFFTVRETERILEQAISYGMRPKIHANELDFSGGIEVGVKYKALSVDHLECTDEQQIAVLLGSGTMPTLLPGAAFFLNLKNPPARTMINAGLPVALASDYNPGTSPSGNMKFVMSLACIKMKMLPEEAINAATINSAYAMGLSETHGSIAVGKRANVFITNNIPSYEFIPYAFTTNVVETVILNGEKITF
ncbi:MAG TPA: imidazolonepropionase [Bacteroidales bacterium]|nr:imidazolonepropionase [Bacteroidales bacterium]